MADQEWSLAHLGDAISRTGAAALEVEASVDNLRAELRDSQSLAAETLALLRQGLAYLGDKLESIEQRVAKLESIEQTLAKLESIEQRLNEIAALRRPSHWIAPYVRSAWRTNQNFEQDIYLHVAIANPGPDPVECELSTRLRGQVQETKKFTIHAGDLERFTWPRTSESNSGSETLYANGLMELTSSGWVLPAAWSTTMEVWGRHPADEAMRTGRVTGSEVLGEAFAVPWYPVD